MAQITELTETAKAILALSLVRSGSIVSLEDDPGRAARVLRKWFGSTRDATQRDYEWNFAKHYATLAANGDPSNFRWKYFYDLPAGADDYCLRVLEVEGCAREDWQVIGRTIATNTASPINVTYTRRVVEVGRWDALYSNLFVASLALAIAPELAEDESVFAACERAVEEAKMSAQPVDASEGVPEEPSDFDFEFVAARYR